MRWRDRWIMPFYKDKTYLLTTPLLIPLLLIKSLIYNLNLLSNRLFVHSLEHGLDE